MVGGILFLTEPEIEQVTLLIKQLPGDIIKTTWLCVDHMIGSRDLPVDQSQSYWGMQEDDKRFEIGT